jgi:hypothetical protein
VEASQELDLLIGRYAKRAVDPKWFARLVEAAARVLVAVMELLDETGLNRQSRAARERLVVPEDRESERGSERVVARPIAVRLLSRTAPGIDSPR